MHVVVHYLHVTRSFLCITNVLRYSIVSFHYHALLFDIAYHVSDILLFITRRYFGDLV
jgi:hypothetical protein